MAVDQFNLSIFSSIIRTDKPRDFVSLAAWLSYYLPDAGREGQAQEAHLDGERHGHDEARRLPRHRREADQEAVHQAGFECFGWCGV